MSVITTDGQVHLKVCIPSTLCVCWADDFVHFSGYSCSHVFDHSRMGSEIYISLRSNTHERIWISTWKCKYTCMGREETFTIHWISEIVQCSWRVFSAHDTIRHMHLYIREKKQLGWGLLLSLFRVFLIKCLFSLVLDIATHTTFETYLIVYKLCTL